MSISIRRTWNNVVRLIRGGMLAGVDAMLLACIRRRGGERKEGVIFCMHGMGDLLLAGHAIAGIAGEMRSRGLVPVLYVRMELVELAGGSFPVGKVEGIDRRRFCRSFTYRAKVLRGISGRFAMAVQPTYNRMLRVEDCLVRATGAAERIGSEGHELFMTKVERVLGDRFYTNLVKHRVERMHELDRYAEFAAGMGVQVEPGPWRIKPPERHAGLPSGRYMVLSPDASDVRRSWPREDFYRAARELSLRHKLSVVVLGTERSKEAIAWEGGDPGLIDLRGQVATKDLPGVIGEASLVLSNDSGIYHMGISLGRPTVAVGGSGLPERYFPYPGEEMLDTRVVYNVVRCEGCNWKCIYGIPRGAPAPCIRNVSWRDVVAAGEVLLRRSEERGVTRQKSSKAVEARG